MRGQLQRAIVAASDQNDRKRLCTLRLVQAAIRDRDSAQAAENGGKICCEEIATLFTKMIKRREEQAVSERTSGDIAGAEQTEREISIIREFMPPMMDESTMRTACAEVVSEIGAAGRRDVSRTISALKKRYPNQIDLGRANLLLRGMLR
ncbi:MAG: GatB/YqeY domain-containing protein [Pseudomonadota bacterium]